VPRATRKLQHPHVLHFIDLRDPAFDALWAFHQQTRPYAPPQETVREFLLMAIQGDPLNSERMSARRQAYVDASFRVRSKLAASLRAAAEDLLGDKPAEHLDAPQGVPPSEGSYR
jgi:hypothetical protein